MAAVTGDMILRDLAVIKEGIECCEEGIVEPTRSLEDKLSRLTSSASPLADDDTTTSTFSRLSSFFFAGEPMCVDPSHSGGIFAGNTSVSSSNPISRTSPDKESTLVSRPSVCYGETQFIAAHDVISPPSSSPSAARVVSPVQNTTIGHQYASRYFQQNEKPAMASVREESLGSQTNSNSEQSRVTPKAGDIEALDHARRAGPLWQSLVGNHIRFPSEWEALLPPTSPPGWLSKWFYVARHRVKGDKRLNSREFGVRSRRSGGRILLHILIRDMHSRQVSREIAVGCFHPSSKEIRKGDPSPEAEEVREVWMAVRWMTKVGDEEPMLDLRPEGNNYEGVVDNFLLQKRKSVEFRSMGSALGHRKAVNNGNVRAVSVSLLLIICISF